MQLLLPSSWGPSSHNITTVINELPSILGTIVAIDIETDEHDNFVGGAVYDGGKTMYYFTDAEQFKSVVAFKQIIGFNVKSDLNWLRLLGLAISSSDLYGDPMIQSYVVNSNRESHGLKDVAKDVLGWSWPTYRDMVGKGRTKKTLDKQDIEKVAEYCGMDTLATWRLHEHFNKTFTPSQRSLYVNIELPLYRLLWDMESRGIRVDTTALATLDRDFDTECQTLLGQLHYYDSTWNPNSPKQTLAVLHRLGIKVDATDKQALAPYKDTEPVVQTLLKYKKIKKLHSTYVVPFLGKDRIHTTFNQVSFQSDGDLHGIRTGRLSSNNPNLQNIPASRTGENYGQRLRGVFIPSQGKVFVDADYSQIEYRLLAHYSQEFHLVDGFHKGLDVHEVTGKLLGCTRSVGKTLNFASIYGAQSEKIANTAGIKVSEAEKFLQTYWQRLPGVTNWISQTKLLATGRRGVSTMAGRFIPLPDLTSRNKWKRAHAERAAVNYIIQGSAADILKVAMIELKKAGYEAVLQVHDELLFEVNPETAEQDKAKILQIMNNVVTLSVPLVADIGSGANWNEAKGD